MTSDVSAAAACCRVLTHARALATWVGEGKPVTAKGVLRPADVPKLAKVLGITVPDHIRTAADVEAIHHPWVAAQAIGLLTMAKGRVSSADGPLAHDRAWADLWLDGLDAVLHTESHDRRQRGAMVACRLVLAALATDPPPAPVDLEDVVHGLLDATGHEEITSVFQAFRRGLMPVEAAVGLLQDFGAVDEHGGITALGRWASQQWRDRTPAQITSDLTAPELLRRLNAAPGQDVWDRAQDWLCGRRESDSAALLLTAASNATPRERITAISIVADLGQDALPAWRIALRLPNVAAHARAALADWDDGPGPADTDRLWLATEHAVASAAEGDLAEAWYTVRDHGGLEAVRASRHPDAVELTQKLEQFAVAGGGRPRLYQLKIALNRMRPPVWRRVLMPAHASLADLNRVIKTVLDWGDDHLHAFTVAGTRFSDSIFGLDEHGDEATVRLARAFPHPGSRIAYRYDLGDCWDHEISLERILDPEETITCPSCVTGRGDAPVEDWNPDFPHDPTPFDKNDINRRLAKLPLS